AARELADQLEASDLLVLAELERLQLGLLLDTRKLGVGREDRRRFHGGRRRRNRWRSSGNRRRTRASRWWRRRRKLSRFAWCFADRTLHGSALPRRFRLGHRG